MKKDQRKRKGRKKMLIILSLCLVSIVTIYFSKKFKEQKKIEETIQQYTDSLTRQDYQQFVNLFSAASFESYSTRKETVQSRYESIFSGIEAKNITVQQLHKEKSEDQSYTISYRLTIDSSCGKIKTGTYHATLQKSGHSYLFEWTPGLIFPGMRGTDSVKIQQEIVPRGKILDNNGRSLAESHEYQQLGLNPSKLGNQAEKQTQLQEISQKFDIPLKTLEKKLQPTWAKGDTFVPVKTLATALSIKEIAVLPKCAIIGREDLRYYPYEESAAHLIGYVGKVTAEDIAKNPQLSENDVIGKTGLEAAYDQQLRGQNGAVITIIGKNKQIKKTLAQIKKIEAQDLHLTIDADAQKIAFDSLDNQPGTIVVSQPQSGQLLVATSAPSFNPNQMVVGISEKDYETYAKDKQLPFLSRFSARYAPGSTFKTITAAIGLDAGKLTTTEERKIKGLKWQKDASWGGFFTTRVKDVPVVNLKKALVFSDNIFFAQKTLEMGEETFRNGLNKFIFEEDLDLPIYVPPATIANQKDFSSDILLADTAYGQGELLIAPITQLAMYSVFMNDGNLTYPKLTNEKNRQVKEHVISQQAARIVLHDLVDSVASPQGYVHHLYQSSFVLAAKTGTAEIKEKQDTLGTENSFLLFFDVKKKDFMGLIMVENSRKNGTAAEKSPAIIHYLEKKYP